MVVLLPGSKRTSFSPLVFPLQQPMLLAQHLFLVRVSWQKLSRQRAQSFACTVQSSVQDHILGTRPIVEAPPASLFTYYNKSRRKKKKDLFMLFATTSASCKKNCEGSHKAAAIFFPLRLAHVKLTKNGSIYRRQLHGVVDIL